LTETQYNLEKSLERLAQNEMSRGLGNQQYVMTGANDLAVLLDELLSNMQMQMQMMSMGSGSGEGMPSPGSGSGSKGFQLPDIIEKQESLSDQMQEGLEKGNKGEEGSEGEGSGEGDEGEGETGKSGKDGQSQNEGGEGNEGMSGEIFEIYKQQQQLRQELQDRINKSGIKGNAKDLLKRMEDIENQLLDKGFNQGTLQKMLNLNYELLKLDEATFEQGQEERREANTNYTDFKNDLRLSPEDIKNYFNTTEILNRESLPLRNDYKEKVQEYFKN